MNYDELKKKHPELNWAEAEDVNPEELEAAAELFDKIAKQKRQEHLERVIPQDWNQGYWPTTKHPEGGLAGYVETSFENLVRHFGLPNGNGDDYKVSTEWLLEESSGLIISIYDYKETNLYDGGLPSVDQFRRQKSYNWHIGGSQKGVEIINHIIKNDLK